MSRLLQSTPIAQLVSALLWVTGLVFFVVAGTLYLTLALIFTPRRLLPVGRFACRALLFTAGQWVRVRDAFPPVDEGPYIYLFNHASLLDTLIVIAVIPEFTGAVGKREQFDIPIWGGVLRRWGAVPLDRRSLGDAIRSLDTVQQAVDGGLSLLVAPEGTRSLDGTLQPFKKGPFHVAANTGAPIVPIAIVGAYRAKRKGSWLLRPGIIEVRVGAAEPKRGETSGTVEALRDATHARMERLLAGPR
jgi:1-acyl-sn-glycerol-3-phosphate acyltransferase